MPDTLLELDKWRGRIISGKILLIRVARDPSAIWIRGLMPLKDQPDVCFTIESVDGEFRLSWVNLAGTVGDEKRFPTVPYRDIIDFANEKALEYGGWRA